MIPLSAPRLSLGIAMITAERIVTLPYVIIRAVDEKNSVFCIVMIALLIPFLPSITYAVEPGGAD